MKRNSFGAALVLAAVFACGAARAGDAGDGEDATVADHLIFNVRLRQEWVDHDGLPENASALTARTRFGAETPKWRGFSLLVEGENVARLTDEFNDTVNGRAAYPVVADPEATELNRAQLSYLGPRNSQFVIGRQWLLLDDQRFIGPVGFRQNDQTFDAVRIGTGDLAPVSIDYAYIDRVHGVFGDGHPLGEFDSDSHMVEARKESPIGKVAVYALLLDFGNAPALSAATYGARLTGEHAGVAYRIEYARQEDYRSNPENFDVSYFRTGIELMRKRWRVGAGLELLGGDGANAFQTPLATLHKFQGFADAFLTTPDDGLRDIYVRGEYRWPKTPLGGALQVGAAAHGFAAEEGGVSLGTEIDFFVGQELARGVLFEAKAAFFNGGDAGPADRTKLWLSLTFDF